MKRLSVAICLLLVGCAIARAGPQENVSPRVQYGTERLRRAGAIDRVTVRVVKGLDQGPEGFRIDSAADGAIRIQGADDSGAMYGCLELERRVRDREPLANLHFADAPVMKL